MSNFPKTIVRNSSSTRTGQYMSEIANDLATELDLLNQGLGVRGLTTGVGDFDAKAAQSFVPGAVICLASYSGMGKTTLVNQWAVAFSSQVWVHVFTLEDDALDASKRMLANVAREDVGKIRAGYAGEKIPTSIDRGLEILKTLNVEVEDVTGIEVWELVQRIITKANDERDGGEVRPHGVVFVDQLSHVRMPTGRNPSAVQRWAEANGWPEAPSASASEHARLEWIVELLQTVARFLRITIVVAHQLNNAAAATEKPDVRSIRSSQGIVHKCESVYIAWVPANLVRENPTAGPGEPKKELVPNLLKEGWLLAPKQRKGEQFECKVTFVGKHQVFLDEKGMQQEKFCLPAPKSETAKVQAAKLDAFYAKLDAKKRAREQQVYQERMARLGLAVEPRGELTAAEDLQEPAPEEYR